MIIYSALFKTSITTHISRFFPFTTTTFIILFVMLFCLFFTIKTNIRVFFVSNYV